MTYVLQSLRPENSRSNPYVSQLLDALESHGITSQYWSWKRALFGVPGVIHLHWPEVLYTGSSRLRSLFKSILFVFVLVKSWAFKTPIVWTVHNLVPHESLFAFQRLVDSLMRRLVTDVIVLNSSSVPVPGIRSNARRHTILHGDYKAWLNAYPRADMRKGSFCCVGMLRPYKGIEELIDSFTHLRDDSLRLTIAGLPHTGEYGRSLENRAKHDDRITFIPRFLEEGEMVELVTSSEAVILPYRAMYNSGIALLALSLDRPVVAPVSETNLTLRDEVGNGWVVLFENVLEEYVLSESIRKVRTPRSRVPNLRNRDWSTVGAKHARVYKWPFTDDHV